MVELKRVLTQTDLVDEARRRIKERLKTFTLKKDDERQRLTSQIERLDAEVQNLVAFIRSTDPTASPGSFDAVRGPLERATNERQRLQHRLDSLVSEPKVPPKLPTVLDISALVLDIEVRIKEEPTAAREALRRLPGGDRIEMHPKPDGSYRAKSVIVSLDLASKTRRRKPKKPRKSKTPEASEVVENDGCAGAICTLYHGAIPRIAATLT